MHTDAAQSVGKVPVEVRELASRGLDQRAVRMQRLRDELWERLAAQVPSLGLNGLRVPCGPRERTRRRTGVWGFRGGGAWHGSPDPGLGGDGRGCFARRRRLGRSVAASAPSCVRSSRRSPSSRAVATVPSAFRNRCSCPMMPSGLEQALRFVAVGPNERLAPDCRNVPVKRLQPSLRNARPPSKPSVTPLPATSVRPGSSARIRAEPSSSGESTASATPPTTSNSPNAETHDSRARRRRIMGHLPCSRMSPCNRMGRAAHPGESVVPGQRFLGENP